MTQTPSHIVHICLTIRLPLFQYLNLHYYLSGCSRDKDEKIQIEKIWLIKDVKRKLFEKVFFKEKSHRFVIKFGALEAIQQFVRGESTTPGLFDNLLIRRHGLCTHKDKTL